MDHSQLELIFNFKSIIEKECPGLKFHKKLKIGSYNKLIRMNKKLYKIKMENYYNLDKNLRILARCKCKECNIYKKTDTNKFINIYKFQVEGYDTELIPLINIYNEIIEKNNYENIDINKIEEILNIIDLHFQERNFDLVKKHNVILHKNKLGAKAQLIIGLLIKVNNSVNYLFDNLNNQLDNDDDDNDDEEEEVLPHSLPVKNKKVIRIITRYNDRIKFIINKIYSKKLSISNVLLSLGNS